MRWSKSARRKSGGSWRCRIKDRAYTKQWRLDNLEAWREGQRRRYAANPAPQRERSRQVRQKNPEYQRAYLKRWKAENADKMRDYFRERSARRRAILAGLPNEQIDQLAVYERDEGRCGICGEAIDLRLAWPDPLSFSLDHIVPVIRGGPHLYSNVQVAHLRCNVQKGAREPTSQEA